MEKSIISVENFVVRQDLFENLTRKSIKILRYLYGCRKYKIDHFASLFNLDKTKLFM